MLETGQMFSAKPPDQIYLLNRGQIENLYKSDRKTNRYPPNKVIEDACCITPEQYSDHSRYRMRSMISRIFVFHHFYNT